MKISKEQIQILNKGWPREELKFPQFKTHSNYLRCMKDLSNNLELKINSNITDKILEPKELKQKIHLINLTIENLKAECKNIEEIKEYSTICVSWIPVKSYYLIFNLFLIFQYLMTGDEKMFKNGHGKTSRLFKQFLKNDTVKFNVDDFNILYSPEEILEWKFPKYENIKTFNSDPGLRKKQIIRKLLDYCREDYKRNKNLNRFTKVATSEFNKSTAISLFEFFYWYRIKSNYRDLEFINSDVPVGDFVDFYNNYYSLARNFYRSFKKVINELSLVRLNKKLL